MMSLRRRPLRTVFGLAAAAMLLLPVAGMAQSKYPGSTLAPPAPAPAPVARPPVTAYPPAYAPPAAPPAPAAPPEQNAAARSLADRLPLDPGTKNLRNQLPADVPGTIRQLGLRVPNGSRVDMRGRTPTPKEVTDALVH